MANLSFYAVCPFGLEELLAGEISACGAERIRAARGGVSFSGSAATAMAVCLNSRLASRVLMKVAEASYWDTRDIYEMAADTPWEKWFGPDLTIKVSANGQRCPLESIDFAVLRIKDGICDRFRDLAGRRPDVERYNPDVRIAAFLTYDTCTFYLDLAGEALFKRGWRLTHGEGKPCGRSSDALGLGSLPNTHRSVLRLGHDRNRSCADGCRHGAWPQPPLRLRKARGL